ncbi:ABC transporter substrate-binding protein [Chloroflexota bacterium]
MRKYFSKSFVVLSVLLTLAVVFTGCGSQKVTISALTVSPETIAANDTVTVSANILSSEDKDVEYNTEFKINEELIDSRGIPVAPGETKLVSFDYSVSGVGSYTADINGQTAVFEVVDIARFETGSISLDPPEIVTGEEFTVSMDLENSGGLSGTFTAALLLDGEQVSSEDVELMPGASKTVTSTAVLETAGSHSIEFCGVSANINVLRAAAFEADSVSVSPSSIYPGDSAAVKATVTNTGEVAGTLPVELKVNGSLKSSKTLTLEAGASGDVSFTVKPDSGGHVSVSVAGKSSSLSVIEFEEYRSEIFFYTVGYPSGSAVFDDDPATVQMVDSDVGGLTVLVDRVALGYTPADYLDGIVSSKQAAQPDWALSSQTEITESGVVTGYKYDYSHTLNGVKWIGEGLVVKKGGYGYYVVYTTPESAWSKYSRLAVLLLDTFTPPDIYNGSYADPDKGLALTLPTDWNAIETGLDASPLALTPPDGEPSAVGKLYVNAAPSGATARDYGEALVSDLNENGYSSVSQGTFSFSNGAAGYECSGTVSYQGQLMKQRFIILVSGSRMFSFTFSGTKAAVDSQAGSINRLVRSFEASSPDTTGYNKNETLFLWGGEIATLDPTRALSTPEGYIGAIFSGLVKNDKDLEVVADLAERWTVSPDGKTYTFYIRENARFHDGKQVTAADVKYSWERACDPATESNKAKSFLGDIVGAQAVLDGNATDISGITVIDDTTLEVTIDSAKQYFLAKLTQPVAYIVDRTNVQQGDKWYENPNGTGPFMLKEWEKDAALVLERNDSFYSDPAKIKYVYFKLFAGNPMTLYESGEIDITGVSSSNIDRVLDTSNPLNDDLLIVDSIHIAFVGLNTTMPPFDDIKVRQAFALALDVDKIIEVNHDNRVTRAAGYLPPQIPGHNSSLQPTEYNVTLANQLISESSYGSVDNFPSVTVTVPFGTSPEVEAIIGMWQQNLGVQVDAEVSSTLENYIDKLNARQLQITVGGWTADYIDPQNFLEILFRSDSPDNSTAYSNPDVDTALTAAGIENNDTNRLRQYQSIEQIILADMPAIPLYHSETNYAIVKPYLKGYTFNPISINIWTDISIDPH